jgi:hypothetical protein
LRRIEKFRAGFGKSGAAIWFRVRHTMGLTLQTREDVMRRLILPLVIIAPLLSVFAAGTGQAGLHATSQDANSRPPDGQQGGVKVAIATGGGLFGPPKDRYRAGQRIPVVISMTNQGREPIYVCDSSTLYQDRPSLLKDGRPLPYEVVQKTMMNTSERDRTCEHLDEDIDLPEQRLLKPGETAVVDWYILSEGTTPMGDMAWYTSLQPGKYELSTQRRMGCCEGPWVESNKISFEILP